MTQRLPFALLLIVVLGCKSDEEKLIEAHRDKLQAVLEKVAALAPIAEKEARLTTETWPVAGVKWPTNVYTDPHGNALWLWSHQLVDPCANRDATFAEDNTGYDYIIFTQTQVSTTGGALQAPKCALAGEKDTGLDERAVKYVEGIKYLLVLRPAVKTSPMLDRAEVEASLEAYKKTGKGTDVEHFTAGRLAGDALLYELGSNKLLGGFTFDAVSSDKLKVDSRSAGIEEMRHDLSKRLEAELAAKLRM